MKLYRSTKDTLWFAFGLKMGWMTFPAEIGGWHQRRRASGMDLSNMREVSIRMGFNTGIPGAPSTAAGAFDPTPKRKPKRTKIICLTCNLTGCVGRCRFQSVEATPFLKSA